MAGMYEGVQEVLDQRPPLREVIRHGYEHPIRKTNLRSMFLCSLGFHRFIGVGGNFLECGDCRGVFLRACECCDEPVATVFDRSA